MAGILTKVVRFSVVTTFSKMIEKVTVKIMLHSAIDGDFNFSSELS